MKNQMMTIGFLVSLITFHFTGGCYENPTEPIHKQNNGWEEVSIFKYASIAYMIHFENKLYVAAIFKQNTIADSAAILYSTQNGVVWDTVKIFDRQIGPMAINGDTLSVLATGQTWSFNKNLGWKIIATHLINPAQTRDMFYFNNKLFVFTYRYFVFTNDTVEELVTSVRTSKFTKYRLRGKEIVCSRPYYVYKDVITGFDGKVFFELMGGITQNENLKPNYPAIFVHNDTLFAGFNTPNRIKMFINDNWINYTDTIGNISDAFYFTPPLQNRPTTIHKNDFGFFVGTEISGVHKWSSSGWVTISWGLPKQPIGNSSLNIFAPITFLESVGGVLISAYGEPWFAPSDGSRGLYILKLEK